MIAYPNYRYNTLKYNSYRVSYYISVPNDRSQYKGPSSNKKVNCDVYDEALKRPNRLIYAKVRDTITNKIFVIVNYHVPCLFWWPSAMLLHVDALLYLFGIIKESHEGILLGDFNIKYNTFMYDYITSHTLNKNQYPSKMWTNNSPGLCLNDTRGDLKAKDTVRITEPNGTIFRATLDYIFVTSQFSVSNFYQDDIHASLPNIIEGSDHIPISCDITLN